MPVAPLGVSKTLPREILVWSMASRERERTPSMGLSGKLISNSMREMEGKEEEEEEETESVKADFFDVFDFLGFGFLGIGFGCIFKGITLLPKKQAKPMPKQPKATTYT